MPVIHDENREKELQTLAFAVLSVSVEFYDNPNGGYENTCPFCNVREVRGGKDCYASMTELKHTPDCAYLIARDLTTDSVEIIT